MKKAYLAVLAVFSSLSVSAFSPTDTDFELMNMPPSAHSPKPGGPYCVFVDSAKYLTRCCDSASGNVSLALKPAAIFDSLPEGPAGFKWTKKQLINLYQHPDSNLALEKKFAYRFFWKGIFPKYEDNKKVLIGKMTSNRPVAEWKEIAGQEKTSVWLIIVIPLLIIAPLLSGLSLRLKNYKVAKVVAAAVAVAAVAVMVAAAEVVAAAVAVAAVAVAVAAAVAAAAEVVAAEVAAEVADKYLKLSASLLLTSVSLSAVSIGLATKLWSVIPIIAIAAVIFLAARYLLVGFTKTKPKTE